MVDRVMPPIAEGGPGGMLACEFADSSSGERHPLRFYVAPFSPTASGSNDDYSYTGFGPFPPSESGLIATFGALGELWAAYYTPSWSLSLVACAYNQDGVLTILPTVPTAGSIVGRATATLPPGVSVRRQFTLRAAPDDQQKFWLWQMPGTQVDIGSAVTPSTGGIDARDRAFMAYLAGSDTAVRSQSGRPWGPDGSVIIWWSERRAAPLLGSEGTHDQFVGPVPPDLPQDGWLWVDTALHAAPYQLKVYRASLAAWVDVGLSVDVDAEVGVVGAECLTFPLAASICNTPAGEIHYHTPGSEHYQDERAYAIPGGHRLERFAAPAGY